MDKKAGVTADAELDAAQRVAKFRAPSSPTHARLIRLNVRIVGTQDRHVIHGHRHPINEGPQIRTMSREPAISRRETKKRRSTYRPKVLEPSDAMPGIRRFSGT